MGSTIGHSGAAGLAGLHALDGELRAAVTLDRVLLIATEGPTDPEGYRAVIG